MKCPNCNAELPDNAKFCLECGAKIEFQNICSNCGTELPQGAKFCMGCGVQIGADTSQEEEDMYKISSVTQDYIGEHLPDDLIMVKIESVATEDFDVADIYIDNEGDICIEGKNEGTTALWATIICRERQNGDEISKELQFEATVNSNGEVKLSEFEWIEDDEDENSVKHVLFKEIEDFLANDGINLHGIDSVVSDNSDSVRTDLYEDGDVRVEGIRQGRAHIRVDFIYSHFGEHKYYTASLQFTATVDENYNVELSGFSFSGIDDEHGENGRSNADTWEKIGSFLNGAASLLGSFVAGYQNTRDALDSYDDEDD